MAWIWATIPENNLSRAMNNVLQLSSLGATSQKKGAKPFQMQLKSRFIALPLAAVLTSGVFFSPVPVQAAPKSKTYKTGAVVLGALGAYLLSKGKTVEGAAVLGGGYLAYKKGEKERKNERYGYNGNAPYYNGNASYPDPNYNNGSYNNGGNSNWDTGWDNGNGSYNNGNTYPDNGYNNGNYNNGSYSNYGGNDDRECEEQDGFRKNGKAKKNKNRGNGQGRGNGNGRSWNR